MQNPQPHPTTHRTPTKGRDKSALVVGQDMQRGLWRWLFALSALLLIPAALVGCDDDDATQSPDTASNQEVSGPGPDNDAGYTYPDFGGTEAPDQISLDLPEYSGQDTSSGADSSSSGADSTSGATSPDVVTLQDGVDPPDTGPALQVSLTTVFPIKGPSSGGIDVDITGTGFDRDTEVFFGATKSPEITFVSDTKLSAEVPEGDAGPVSVRVVNTHGNDTLPDGFTYADPISVNTIDPTRSPSTGGVPFTVRGSGFEGAVTVSIGGRTAPDVAIINSTTISGVTPPGVAGPSDLRVTSEAGTTLSRGAVVYYDPTAVSNIFPSTGIATGGDTVTISGVGFEAPVAVSIGGKATTITGSTPTSLTVTTPSNPPGAADVVVTSANGTARVEGGFLYLLDPSDNTLTLVDVVPDFGHSAGGNTATARGTGFNGPPLSLTVGGAPATILDNTNSSILFTLPPGAPGADVDVVLSSGGQDRTLVDGYTYLARFDAVTPSRGEATGGTTVTLEGAGFKPGSQVYFGTQAATGVSVAADGSSITATTPPGQGGLVHVSVRYSGYEVTLPDAFYYTEDVALYAHNPRRGSQAGGTLVTLTGKGFAPDLGVTMDGVAVDPSAITVIDPYTATFRTPAHEPAIVDVAITQGSDTIDSPDRFTYFNPGNDEGGGWGSSVVGSLNVTVLEMQSGDPVPEAFVIVGVDAGTDRQGVTDINGQITFSDLDLAGVQTVTASKQFLIPGEEGDPPTPFEASATVTTIDAENVTLLLYKPSGGGGGGEQPPRPPDGLIYGSLIGVDKVSLSNDGNLRRRAIIITSETLNPDEPNPDPGPDSILDGNGDYRLKSRLGDVAVIALCGVYNVTTGSFTPKFFDMQRFVYVSSAIPGDPNSEQRVDLNCDKPMNWEATIKLVNSPLGNGTDINAVFPILDIGPEGYLAEPWYGQGTVDSFQFPNLLPLTGEFADMSYMLQGVSVAIGAQGADYPQSTIVLDDVQDFSAPIEMSPMMPVPFMVTPLDGTTLQNGHVEWTIANRDTIDMYSVSLYKPGAMQLELIWQIFLPGDATGFDLPDFTGLPGAPPMHSGETYLFISAVKMAYPNFDFDQFTWQDSSPANHRSWSEALIVFNMP